MFSLFLLLFYDFKNSDQEFNCLLQFLWHRFTISIPYNHLTTDDPLNETRSIIDRFSSGREHPSHKILQSIWPFSSRTAFSIHPLRLKAWLIVKSVGNWFPIDLTRLTPTSLCLFEHELFDYSRIVTTTTNACVGIINTYTPSPLLGPHSATTTSYWHSLKCIRNHLGDYKNKEYRQFPWRIHCHRRTISLKSAPKLLLVRCPSSQVSVISKIKEGEMNRYYNHIKHLVDTNR